MDERNYLNNAEKPRLPHCFSRMVPQVLIVVGCNYGHELFQCVLRILTKENGWLLSDSVRTLHQTLPPSIPNRGNRLLYFSFQTYDGLRGILGLLWKMISLLLLLSLSGRFG